MLRPVTVRTLKNAQEASNALLQDQAAATAAPVPSASSPAPKPNIGTDVARWTASRSVQPLAPIPTQPVRTPIASTPVWDPNMLSWGSAQQAPQGPYLTPGGMAARAAAAASIDPNANSNNLEVSRWQADAAKRLGLDGADPNTQQKIDDLWAVYESTRIAQEAMSAQMIQDAVDQAALGYDEKLISIGRSIDDTRGRLTDSDKITDYYLSTLVEPWRQAAKAAAAVDGADVKGLIAGHVAEVGEAFDVADENTQAYLDKIGGVPMAQRIAITDGIRETQNAFEGMTAADMAGMVAITDAQGNVLEKSAEASLARATFEGEAQRFVTAGMLGRDLDKLYQDRSDTIANRDKAVDLAKRQANAAYGYTGEMPERNAFLDQAREAVLAGMGLDEVGKAEFHQMFSEAFSGQNGWFLDSYDVDEDGEFLGSPIRITSQLELEKAYARMPVEIQRQAKEDFDVLQDMFAVNDLAIKDYDGRVNYYQSSGGHQAPANAQNWIDQTPAYVQRQQYVAGYAPMLKDRFPQVYKTEQMRAISPTGQYGKYQAANSDHLSGGALDIYIKGNDPQSGWEVVNYLKTFPTFSFAKWQEDGHYDHIHVSFKLPQDIGSNPLVDTFQATSADAPYASSILSPEVRSAVSRVLAGSQKAN